MDRIASLTNRPIPSLCPSRGGIKEKISILTVMTDDEAAANDETTDEADNDG
jgi:hypothetical protein